MTCTNPLFSFTRRKPGTGLTLLIVRTKNNYHQGLIWPWGGWSGRHG